MCIFSRRVSLTDVMWLDLCNGPNRRGFFPFVSTCETLWVFQPQTDGRCPMLVPNDSKYRSWICAAETRVFTIIPSPVFCQAVIIVDWFINARLESPTNRLQVRLRSSLQASLAPKFTVRRAPLVEPCASSCIPLASFLCAHREGMWGVEVQLHSFVTWNQLDVSGYLHISTVSLHREQPPKPIEGCVVPRADPDPWQKNVFPLPTRNRTTFLYLSFSP